MHDIFPPLFRSRSTSGDGHESWGGDSRIRWAPRAGGDWSNGSEIRLGRDHVEVG